MKANRVHLFIAAVLSMLLGSTASCVPKPTAPPPRPAAAPAPAPTPKPLPPPSILRWNDAPISPGVWTWRMEGSRSVARFANDMLVLSCNRDAQAVTLMRPGMAQTEVPVTILTSSMKRTVSGLGVAGPPPVIAVTLPARDPLLDAIAFSRGRFAVETAGLPTLYVPSWPEVSRVVEDCR